MNSNTQTRIQREIITSWAVPIRQGTRIPLFFDCDNTLLKTPIKLEDRKAINLTNNPLVDLLLEGFYLCIITGNMFSQAVDRFIAPLQRFFDQKSRLDLLGQMAVYCENGAQRNLFDPSGKKIFDSSGGEEYREQFVIAQEDVGTIKELFEGIKRSREHEAEDLMVQCHGYGGKTTKITLRPMGLIERIGCVYWIEEELKSLGREDVLGRVRFFPAGTATLNATSKRLFKSVAIGDTLSRLGTPSDIPLLFFGDEVPPTLSPWNGPRRFEGEDAYALNVPNVRLLAVNQNEGDLELLTPEQRERTLYLGPGPSATYETLRIILEEVRRIRLTGL